MKEKCSPPDQKKGQPQGFLTWIDFGSVKNGSTCIYTLGPSLVNADIIISCNYIITW